MSNMLLLVKLKHLKVAIKTWRAIESNKENLGLDTLKKEINRLDLEAESQILTDQEMATYKMGKQRLREITKLKKRIFSKSPGLNG